MLIWKLFLYPSLLEVTIYDFGLFYVYRDAINRIKTFYTLVPYKTINNFVFVETTEAVEVFNTQFWTILKHIFGFIEAFKTGQSFLSLKDLSFN